MTPSITAKNMVTRNPGVVKYRTLKLYPMKLSKMKRNSYLPNSLIDT